MYEFFRRLSYLFNRQQRERELADEMAFHQEMATLDGAGGPFGNQLRLREEAHDAWGWTWLDRLRQDLSYGFRTLRRSPGFTATAVLVLAIGVGVNVAAFGLFNLACLQSLPVKEPETLVRLQRRSPDASTNVISFSSMMFYRDHAKTLQAVMGTMGVRVVMEQDVEPVGVELATENYFDELGEAAGRGRLIDARDGKADAAPVAVLSHGFWRRRFGADPAVVGKTIRLNHKPAIVIGVTALNFAALADSHPDIWLPASQTPYFVDGSKVLTDPGEGAFEMWGRLAAGVTPKLAEQELRALTSQLRKQYPKGIWEGEYIRSDPGGHLQVFRKDMYIVLSLVGLLALLILLVACANLGGLLLARGITREREMTIRMAIGAGRMRIFRQLFTESMILAALGSVAGLVLGYLVLRIGLATTNARPWMSATPDWRVMLFALGLAMLTAVVFGLTPALQMARQKQRKTGARQLLVGTQILASCVLLIVSSLLGRAAQHALFTYPGFGYEKTFSIDPNLSGHGYSPTAAQAFLKTFCDRVRALPGVTAVALSSMPPLGHERIAVITNTINGRKTPIYPFQVDPEFFSAMEIPILRGRNLLPGERNAVVVSESLARQQWPGENPVGKRDASGSSKGDIVVGVARNARLLALNDGDAVELYHVAQLSDMPNITVVATAAGSVDRLPRAMQAVGEAIDPRLFVYVRALKSEFARNTQGIKSIAMSVSLLGAVAVWLAGLGLLGLITYVVSDGRKDIAIRMALGAQPRQVLSSVLRQFVKPVALGLLAGICLTALLSNLLRETLYGVSNLDPVSYFGAVVVLVGIVAIAALWPARRALRVDPRQALHRD